MEHWNGSVLDTNATCPNIGQKCLHLVIVIQLPTQMEKKCHCTEYDKISGNYLGETTLGGVGTTHKELINASMPFFVELYGQPPETSMESAR